MSVLSKKIFLDNSIFSAFVDRAHSKHEQSAAYFRYFGQEEYKLFTDIANLQTTYETIYKDISPSLSRDFMRTMYLSDVNIVYPEESDAKAALKALVNYKSTELTFTQAQMAVLCIKRDISQICSFDYVHNLFGLTLFYLPI